MKWLITFLLIVTAVVSPNTVALPADAWEDDEKKLRRSYLALSAIDTYQTFRMIDCQKKPRCSLIEKNPILGEKPHKMDVFALKVAGNIVIYELLDNTPDDRLKALKWITSVQGLVITHNGIYYHKRF